MGNWSRGVFYSVARGREERLESYDASPSLDVPRKTRKKGEFGSVSRVARATFTKERIGGVKIVESADVAEAQD